MLKQPKKSAVRIRTITDRCNFKIKNTTAIIPVSEGLPWFFDVFHQEQLQEILLIFMVSKKSMSSRAL